MSHWLFIHIMKTAGTSFRTMLENHLGEGVYPTKEEVKQLPDKFYLRPPQFVERLTDGRLDLTGRRVICGHYSAAFVEALPGNWRTATVLREPVARTLSMIAHHHRGRRRKLDFRGRLPVTEYLENPSFVASKILNYQTKVFAAGPMDNVNQPYPVDATAFERARARLDAIDFIGITEMLGESVRVFERLSGMALGADILHAGKNRRYSATEADVARIRELVGYDIELYEIARRKMQAQVAAAA